jgi:hypothetical protein
MVLHLHALGSGVQRGAVDELMEEGAGEGEGGDCRRCHGFDGGVCVLPSPSSTLSSPTSMMPTTTTTTMTTMRTTRVRSQGVGRDDKRMGFQGGCKEEKGDGGQFNGAGGQGVDGEPAKMLFCIVSLIAYTGIKYKQHMHRNQ